VFVDRRAFLRSLGGALRDEAAPLGPAARPATCLATSAELAELAERSGLAARLDAVHALARVSVRLTPVHERTTSFLGGDADVALDLGEVAQIAGSVHGLPAEGVLWCRGDRVAVRGDRAQGAVPLSLSAELTLPRVWAAPAQALELSDAEMTGWEELRARLAGLQGVERKAPDHVMRLLGYPDERTGDMPALCEARARDRRAAQTPDAAARWQLLLQLPAGEGKRRFVWVPGPGELAGALAFVR
jgi:hypothetical protein